MGNSLAMNNYCVYVHTNKQNGMRYVGITSQEPETRWSSGYGYYKQEHFFRAIKKYGWRGFEHEVVASDLSLEEAAREEQRLIALYNTTDKRFGYNKSIGGEAGAKGVIVSDKERKRRSETLKQLWQRESFRKSVDQARRRTVSEETRQKMSFAQKGHTVSDETRRKLSEAKKGVPLGKRTPKQIQHMKEHHAGGAEKSPVVCLETGVFYESINDAVRATGINKKGISGCCRKVKHYNTAGGYHWDFAEVK